MRCDSQENQDLCILEISQEHIRTDCCVQARVGVWVLVHRFLDYFDCVWIHLRSS